MPAKSARIWTFWTSRTGEENTVNVPTVWPAGMFTTVEATALERLKLATAGLSSVTLIVAPPSGAAAERVTVPVDEAGWTDEVGSPPGITFGESVSEPTSGSESR